MWASTKLASFLCCQGLSRGPPKENQSRGGILAPTVDGYKSHFAPPKKPWNNDSPVNTNTHNGSHGLKVVQDFVHPLVLVPALADFIIGQAILSW